MIVIAVKDLDIDARIGHTAGQLAELTRLGLIESLDENVVHGEYSDACRFERVARGVAVLKQKVRDAASVVGGMDDPRAAAFDAHAGAAEGVAHFGECAGTIIKRDGEILHS